MVVTVTLRPAIYISELIRIATSSGHVSDLNNRYNFLTAKLLKHGCRYRELRKPYSWDSYLTSSILLFVSVILVRFQNKRLASNDPHEGQLGPKFNVCGFRRIVRKTDFSEQFGRVVNR